MSQDENAAAIPDEERDNLAELDGIGERYAAALAKAGIHSLSDLIKYTPKTLSVTLKERAGIRISEKRIDSENWIGQARQALGRKKLPIVRLPPAAQAVPSAADVWEERSTFQIRFMVRKHNGEEVWQTQVYNDISGEEISLEGVRRDIWANWILGQAGLQTIEDEPSLHSNQEADAAQIEIQRLQNERDVLSQSLSAAQEEVSRARADAAQAKAEAESSAADLISVKQQAQAQIDAAFRAAAAAQVIPKLGEAAAKMKQALGVQTSETAISDAAPNQNSETPTTPGGRPALRAEIKSVMLEGSASKSPGTGKLAFAIEGSLAPLVTRLAPRCIIEIRGVNPHGSTSVLLAKLEEPLVPDQFVYEVPFTIRAIGPGPYELHASLRLNAVGSTITAAHRQA